MDGPAAEVESASSRPLAAVHGATACVLSVKPVPALNRLVDELGAGLPPTPMISSLAPAIAVVGPADGAPVPGLEANWSRGAGLP